METPHAAVARSAIEAVPRSVLPARADSFPWSPDSLEQTFGLVAERLGGEVGVATIHIETGRRAGWNVERRLPMASVYKLPIALEVLRRVDQGTLSLADSITVEPRDFVQGGASPVAASAGGRPVTLTVGRLLAYMTNESDNTASDVLLRAVGGPPAVEGRIRELGIEAIDVSRYEAEIFAEARGARGHDLTDSRDTATPAAMAELLAVFHRGALRAGSRDLLLELLTSTRTGPERIKALLPPNMAVAHKTGTFGPVTNDVGIVTLPDGTHLAIAVLVRAPETSLAERERAIAEIALAAYEAFTQDP